MYSTKEIIANAKDAFELAKLINNLKYKDYQKTVALLRLYGNDLSISDEAKIHLNKIADDIELKFSNKIKIWFWWFDIRL